MGRHENPGPRVNPGWFVLAAGAALMVAAATQMGSVRAVLARSSTAPGRVVTIEEVAKAPHGDGSDTETIEYFPWVEFRDARGAMLKFRARTAHPHDAFRVGDTVAVRYQADDPAAAVIDRFTEIWHLPLALALGGAFCVTFGVVLLVQRGAAD
jgi:hypothetical protein